LSGEAAWTRALPDAELAPATRRSLRLQNRPVLLLRIGSDLHAIEDRCPHALQPLNDGTLDGCVLTCARHGASFDLGSGKPINGVSARPLLVLKTRVVDGWIEVELPVAPVHPLFAAKRAP
jgi:3-phenylpropionate/trans-cinnamate dioxygenase ferredoxin component